MGISQDSEHLLLASHNGRTDDVVPMSGPESLSVEAAPRPNLMTLPPELRRIIYQLVFGIGHTDRLLTQWESDFGVFFYDVGYASPYTINSFGKKSIPPSLLLVNHQIFLEAQREMFRDRCFTISVFFNRTRFDNTRICAKTFPYMPALQCLPWVQHWQIGFKIFDDGTSYKTQKKIWFLNKQASLLRQRAQLFCSQIASKCIMLKSLKIRFGCMCHRFNSCYRADDIQEAISRILQPFRPLIARKDVSFTLLTVHQVHCMRLRQTEQCKEELCLEAQAQCMAAAIRSSRSWKGNHEIRTWAEMKNHRNRLPEERLLRRAVFNAWSQGVDSRAQAGMDVISACQKGRLEYRDAEADWDEKTVGKRGLIKPYRARSRSSRNGITLFPFGGLQEHKSRKR